MGLDKRDIKTRKLLSGICCVSRQINITSLEQVVLLAIEIAREGREGKKIGTMFIVSDNEEVLKRSRGLILDPLLGHPAEIRHIGDHNLRETIKELAQLDGAFIVSDDGVVISAARYIDASSEGIKLPLGLGSRHMAAASISKSTRAVAVVVSESSMVRIFDNGEMIGEIIPEIWMMNQYSTHIEKPFIERSNNEITVLSKD
ncbi:diadenylate cyclase [Desulfobacterota bacterium AH_259_B03_O07]|nr:diadenylate cyclase [Desulfobacterota bacterium AH_259_B03_O07]